MSTDFPEIGKIQDGFLKSHVFPSSGAKREEVVSGPKYGVDTSVVRISDKLSLVSATDPASLIPTLGLEESAWLTVHLVASDIATAGCLPQYAQFCLNLPPGTTEKQFDGYWKAVSGYCENLGVAITGGHTGRIHGQESTIAGGVTMMSCVASESVLTSDMAQPGDDLILVKESAISSTAILALSFPETIANACGQEVLQKGQELFYQSSAVDAAMAAVETGIHSEGVRAMHDVTECGVIGATVEMMMAAGCGVELYKNNINVGEAQKAITQLFGYDPLHAIGSGALLLSVAPGKSEAVMKNLRAKGYPSTVIGKVQPKEEGMCLIEDERKPLNHPGTDPYWGTFFEALQKGLK